MPYAPRAIWPALRPTLPAAIRAALDKSVKLGAKGEMITFEKALEVFKKDAGLDVPVRGKFPMRPVIDPKNPLRRKELRGARRVEVLEPIVSRGELVRAFPPLDEVRERRRDQLAHLHESHRRLLNAHEYKVGLTEALWKLKEKLMRQ